MSQFTKPLVVSPLGDGKHWILREEFEYHVAYENSDVRIVIPVMMVHDFASIPQILWWWKKPSGKHGPAAVLHDWLYQNQGKVEVVDGAGEKTNKTYSRQKCDDLFLEALRVLGVGEFDAVLMHTAVRWFGKGAWNSHTNRGPLIAKRLPTKVSETVEDIM